MHNGYTVLMDSGVGGVTVLSEVRKLLPQENFIYFADFKNAPYGDKSAEDILEILKEHLDYIQENDLKAVLLACNTATSAAAGILRREMTIPVLGMEPALKPAVTENKGNIIVLATSLTLKEKKFKVLMEKMDAVKEGQKIIPLACSGLMEMVEEDPFDPKISDYLKNLLEPYLENLEALVLGCTHYVFLKPVLRELYPALKLYDGNQGVSRHLVHTLEEYDFMGGKGETIFLNSIENEKDSQDYIFKCKKYYRMDL